jgi:hypothetical protein
LLSEEYCLDLIISVLNSSFFVQREHEDALAKLTASVEAQPFPPLRHSPVLRNLRAYERKMAACKKYYDAQKAKEEADALVPTFTRRNAICDLVSSSILLPPFRRFVILRISRELSVRGGSASSTSCA